jgi:hypothetical protein
MVKKSINTTAKGDAFETRVFAIFESLIQTEQLPLNCKRSKIYHQKQYKSTKSTHDIPIDISIETFMPDSEEIAMLTLIECKDYKSPIRVEKIREFQQRIEEIGAQKGYFITTSSFQSGARDLAIAEHIGIAVVDESNNLQWKARRIAIRDKYEVNSDVIDIITDQTTEKLYGFVAEGKACYTNLYDFLHKELELPIQQTFTIKYLTDEEILREIYDKLHLSIDEHSTISDDKLLQYVIDQGYSLKSSSITNKVLGEINFETKEVCISDSLAKGSPRWRFTVAHELGHIVLHSDAIHQSQIRSIEESINDEELDVEISDETIKRMEIQANSFASQLLIPEDKLMVEYCKLFIEKGVRNFPNLHIDSQPCNIELLKWFLANLALHFNVSKAAIEKRLQKLGLLKIVYVND